MTGVASTSPTTPHSPVQNVTASSSGTGASPTLRPHTRGSTRLRREQVEDEEQAEDEHRVGEPRAADERQRRRERGDQPDPDRRDEPERRGQQPPQGRVRDAEQRTARVRSPTPNPAFTVACPSRYPPIRRPASSRARVVTVSRPRPASRISRLRVSSR